jgi:hypothetical protein
MAVESRNIKITTLERILTLKRSSLQWQFICLFCFFMLFNLLISHIFRFSFMALRCYNMQPVTCLNTTQYNQHSVLWNRCWKRNWRKYDILYLLHNSVCGHAYTCIPSSLLLPGLLRPVTHYKTDAFHHFRDLPILLVDNVRSFLKS